MKATKPMSILVGALALWITTTASWALGEPVACAIQTGDGDPRCLTVGIQLFDPGLGSDRKSLRKLTDEGTFPYVRRAEARYFPLQLKRALERSGRWGAVRLAPRHHVADVNISGVIVSSTGRKLKLHIRVVDSRGKKWLSKRYTGRIGSEGYREVEIGKGPDPFDHLYDEIARDVLRKRERKSDEKIATIRELTVLRFAAKLLPDVFADYVSVDRKGRFEIRKLPARNDEMMERIARLHLRDRIFVDTLAKYHEAFAAEIRQPYDAFRAQSFAREQEARRLRRGSLGRKILGGTVIVGGLLLGGAVVDDDDRESNTVSTLVAAAAFAQANELFENAQELSARARWNEEALRELGGSLEAEIEPTVLWFEGQTHRFIGTVQAQYAAWHEVLKEIYLNETGRSSEGGFSN